MIGENESPARRFSLAGPREPSSKRTQQPKSSAQSTHWGCRRFLGRCGSDKPLPPPAGSTNRWDRDADNIRLGRSPHPTASSGKSSFARYTALSLFILPRPSERRREHTAWLAMQDSNSEVSSRNMFLKARADSEDPSRIPAMEATRV